jgi:ketosteroid isomerase-like protein
MRANWSIEKLTQSIMKKAFLILLILSVIEIKAQTSADPVSVTKKIFEAFNAHNWNRMLSYYHEQAEFKDPAYPQPVRNLALIRQHHEELHAWFPDIYDDVQAIYPSGQNVIVEFISRGTSSDGQKFELPICTVLTFKDGKVIRDATYYDVTH